MHQDAPGAFNLMACVYWCVLCVLPKLAQSDGLMLSIAPVLSSSSPVGTKIPTLAGRELRAASDHAAYRWQIFGTGYNWHTSNRLEQCCGILGCSRVVRIQAVFQHQVQQLQV